MYTLASFISKDRHKTTKTTEVFTVEVVTEFILANQLSYWNINFMYTVFVFVFLMEVSINGNIQFINYKI